MVNKDRPTIAAGCNLRSAAQPPHSLAVMSELSAAELEGLHGVVADSYMVVMADRRCCRNFDYGRKPCDFSTASVLFVKPGDTIHVAHEKKHEYSGGRVAAFHPDLFTDGTVDIRTYTFFSYNENEALHLSACERKRLRRCMDDIACELRLAVDEYSKSILERLVGLTLDICRRFYTRQFIMRSGLNSQAMDAIPGIVADFYTSHTRGAQRPAIPTTGYLADRIGCSAAYLEDMTHSETGLSVTEQVRLTRLELAKTMLLETDRSVDFIAKHLGFCSTNCLRQIIEKTMGVTPEAFRTSN